MWNISWNIISQWSVSIIFSGINFLNLINNSHESSAKHILFNTYFVAKRYCYLSWIICKFSKKHLFINGENSLVYTKRSQAESWWILITEIQISCSVTRLGDKAPIGRQISLTGAVFCHKMSQFLDFS